MDDFLEDPKDTELATYDGEYASYAHIIPPEDLNIKRSSLPNAVLRTLQALGGDVWLYEQAKEYPKEFMGMIKAVMPKEFETTEPNITINIANVLDGDKPTISVQS